MATECNTMKKFTKKQKLAAELLADPTFQGTVTELCDRIGVARSTFYRWMENSAYVSFVDEKIGRYANSELSRVWKSLIKNASNGNVKAQKLYFELLGKYKQTVEVEGGPVVIVNDIGDIGTDQTV